MIANTQIRKIITDSVNKISFEYKPKKIILFGSYAYGNPTEESDIDFLIIKNTEKRPIDRWLEVKKFLRGISQTVSISPLVYTEKEIADRLAIKDFFVQDILEKGEVLYG